VKNREGLIKEILRLLRTAAPEVLELVFYILLG
jgi:hypothetical protein